MKLISSKRQYLRERWDNHVGQKLFYFQAFGLEVFIVSDAVNVACFTLFKETGRSLNTRFGENRRAVYSNDAANQPNHFKNCSHCVSDMKIRALCSISGSNDSHKRHEMRLISKLVGTVDHLGIVFITLINALCLTHS